MSLKIVTAEERLAEKRGVKALILGPAGVGKTSLLRTVDSSSTLFIDLEAGDLAVSDVQLSIVKPRTWQECRDIAVLTAGPDPSVPRDTLYSEQHYEAVYGDVGDAFAAYDTLFVDSITVAARLCFKWCEQQPECKSRNGDTDTRSVYGLHGREMLKWLSHLQHARSKNVIFVCLLDQKEDDFGRATFSAQIEGQKASRELPGIVDELITMAIIRPAEGEPYRAFVTNPDNEWGYPAKDRSGRLNGLEEPDLGKLITKLTATKMMEVA